MDPHQRITAREAIEHDYFDELRAVDPEYNPGATTGHDVNSENSSAVDRASKKSGGAANQPNNKRLLSPELLNKRPKQNSKSMQSKQMMQGGKNSQNITSPESHMTSNNGILQQNVPISKALV